MLTEKFQGVFISSSDFSHLTHDSFLPKLVAKKLARPSELVLLEGILDFEIANILRHWGVTFVANLIGGGFLIGLPYAFLNKNEETYVD